MSDYRYELRVVCFCAIRGVPVTITVHDGRVTDAVYTTPAPGHTAGEQVTQRWLRLTINDIINSANDPASAHVAVSWPREQSHPSSVWIDRTTDGTDDETWFDIRHVEPAAVDAATSAMPRNGLNARRCRRPA